MRSTATTDLAVVSTRRQLYVWSRLLLQLSDGVANNQHRHFGAFLLLAPDAPIEVNIETSPAPQTRVVGQAILVAPNAWHHLDARGSRVATLVLGPDHPWFGYVLPALNGAAAASFPLARLTGNVDWDRIFAGEEDCATMHRFIEVALAAMTDRKFEPHMLDTNISVVVDLLNSSDATIVDPAELASAVGLTAVTLMRRFKRQLGVRIREYVLWRRLINAIPLLAEHRTLTEVAHRAGFYDQSHLSRTARRMFDLQPSSVAGVRVHVCTKI